MTSTLTIIAGPDAGRSCELSPGSVLVVGRGRECGLQLSDPGVSRIHCRLISMGEGVRLEDADSRFGTIVNRQAVFVQTLQAGDLIEIGDTKLRFNRDSSSIETIMPLRLASVPSEWFADGSMMFDAVEIPDDRPEPDRDHNRVGLTFSRFRTEMRLNQGTSGTVYRATDLADGRVVALKVYEPSLFSDEQAMSRFLRAMRTMIPLNHPHLINLIAAGRSGGRCFTASEFVEGESVAQMVSRIGIAGMLDWRSTWRMAMGLSAALTFLHDRQILHRSLRPGNILIRAADHCVKLGDALLAKSLDELDHVALTARGDIVSDIHYSAPEQLSEGVLVDHRADIYSLGATLYALMTGRPPFVGSTADVIRKILTTDPDPPKRLNLAIPGAFEGLVLKMLSKRPDDRISTAAAILEQLQRIGRFEGLGL